MFPSRNVFLINLNICYVDVRVEGLSAAFEEGVEDDVGVDEHEDQRDKRERREGAFEEEAGDHGEEGSGADTDGGRGVAKVQEAAHGYEQSQEDEVADAEGEP